MQIQIDRYDLKQSTKDRRYGRLMDDIIAIGNTRSLRLAKNKMGVQSSSTKIYKNVDIKTHPRHTLAHHLRECRMGKYYYIIILATSFSQFNSYYIMFYDRSFPCPNGTLYEV